MFLKKKSFYARLEVSLIVIIQPIFHLPEKQQKQIQEEKTAMRRKKTATVKKKSNIT
jgi:hypothetical protein